MILFTPLALQEFKMRLLLICLLMTFIILGTTFQVSEINSFDQGLTNK